MTKHFGNLTSNEFRVAFERLCHDHTPHNQDFDVRHFYTALRLDEWKAVLDGHEVSDTQEAVLRAVIHGRERNHDLFKGFAKILKDGPFSPADVLCDIYKRYPGIVVLMGLSDEDLQNLMKESQVQDIVLHLVPRDWKGSMMEHFYILLRSMEVWLYAFYRSLPREIREEDDDLFKMHKSKVQDKTRTINSKGEKKKQSKRKKK